MGTGSSAEAARQGHGRRVDEAVVDAVHMLKQRNDAAHAAPNIDQDAMATRVAEMTAGEFRPLFTL